ncbi:MAG: glycosyltransferase [Bacteroidia bacterium]
MKKTKIVIFIDWYLPAYKAGGPVKSIANLIELLKDKAEFYLITGDRDLGDNVPFEGIELNKWTSNNGVNLLYLNKKKQSIYTYKEQLNLIQPDIVYINGIFSINFSIKPLFASKNKTKTIIAPRGMLGEGALKIKSFKKRFFLKLTNFLGLYKNVIWHVTDDTEKNEVQININNYKEVYVIPNVPIKVNKEIFQLKEKSENKLKLVFISRISKKKNLYFLLELINDLKSNQNIELDIWGPIEDKYYFNKCKNLIDTINQYNKNTVYYKGELIWNEIENTIKKYDFFILPTLHENFGHVIFESLTFGVPVIISNNTPWRNLQQLKMGWDLDLNNKDEWIRAITAALKMTKYEYNEYCIKCIDFTKKWFSEQKLSDKYSILFNL